MNHSTYLTAWQAAIRRRAFLQDSVSGLGGIALAGLLDPSLFSTAGRAADTAKPADRWRGVLNPPHRPVKARRVIHLCMAGGPSQFESLDYKPRLKGQRPRSSHPRLLNLDGGRRHQAGGDVRGHRRAWPPRRGQCVARARPPCDDPPPLRHRSHAAQLQVPGAGRPPYRRRTGQGGKRAADVSLARL